jgi:hypothetical protein
MFLFFVAASEIFIKIISFSMSTQTEVTFGEPFPDNVDTKAKFLQLKIAILL